MAFLNQELIHAIGKTIEKLKSGAPYQWGHMGSCNCGNLAQELIHMSKDEIHRHAMAKCGDWTEQLHDYCPGSGFPMDLMISKMLDKGLTMDDLAHLERLSDPNILARIPFEKRVTIQKNNRSDATLYLEKWLEMLENQWIEIGPVVESKKTEKNNLSKVFA